MLKILLSLVCTDLPITKIKKAMSIYIILIQFSAPQWTPQEIDDRWLTHFAAAHQYKATDDLESARFNVPFKQEFHLAAGTHDLAGQSIIRSRQRNESRTVMLTVSTHPYHTARIQTSAMQYNSQVSHLLYIFLQYAITPRCDPISN